MRAIVLLLLAACASSPRQSVPEAPPPIPETRVTPTPAALNPVGEFEFSSALPDGTPIKGAITISGTPGAYTGSINAGEHGVFPIRNVAVTGQAMVINADHPDGPLEVRLTFVANDFNGSWRLGDQTGEMVGKRRP
ncbi:MAG TPA: hypothetical protein VJ802_08005 [Gemmatimonadaceae bacterium]|nr:hypothetical protein [Gemmatimonadaceae bacterium]